MQYQLNADYGRRHDNSINLASLGAGKHTVTIYETKIGFLAAKNKKKCIALPCF